MQENRSKVCLYELHLQANCGGPVALNVVKPVNVYNPNTNSKKKDEHTICVSLFAVRSSLSVF